MEQNTINQRLKFLAEKLADSTRAFGLAIGDNSSNTHKYLHGATRPSPEYLGKVLLRFRDINAYWLLTGEGEAFTLESHSQQTQHQSQQKSTSSARPDMNQTQAIENMIEKQLDSSHYSIKIFTFQLEERDKLIEQLQINLRDKQEIIDLLKSKQSQ